MNAGQERARMMMMMMLIGTRLEVDEPDCPAPGLATLMATQTIATVQLSSARFLGPDTANIADFGSHWPFVLYIFNSGGTSKC